MSCILKFRSLKISLETLERSFHRGEKRQICRKASWDIWNSPLWNNCKFLKGTREHAPPPPLGGPPYLLLKYFSNLKGEKQRFVNHLYVPFTVRFWWKEFHNWAALFENDSVLGHVSFHHLRYFCEGRLVGFPGAQKLWYFFVNSALTYKEWEPSVPLQARLSQ